MTPLAIHLKTLFLLQSKSSAPYSNLAPQRIYRYALSPELLSSATGFSFSYSKGVLR